MLAAGCSFSASVFAQSAPTATATATVEDVIVVTGSLGEERSVTDSLSPIDVIDEQALLRTGRSTLAEALSATAPSYSGIPGPRGGIGLAVNSATLRGLSNNNVLVLVNGKRRHASALLVIGNSSPGLVGTDLSLIPVSAVERVEILRDGAAAQYGSDAIAGVINVILKSASEGGSASLLGGAYFSTVGDQGLRGARQNFDINQGIALGEDGGFLNLSGSYNNQDATNATGAVAPNGQPGGRQIYFPIDGQPDPREFGTSRFRQIEGVPDSETALFSYNAELPFNAQVTGYSTGTYGYRNAFSYGTFRPAAVSQNIESIYPDGFLPEFNVIERDYQFTAGLRGQSDWNWDFSTSYAKSDGNWRNNNTLNPTLGEESPTDFDNGHQILSDFALNADLHRSVQTGFFEQPLRIATGVEHRRLLFKQTPGQYESYADGPYIFPIDSPWPGLKPNPGAAGSAGYSPEDSGSYARNSQAIYLDLTQQITPAWELGAAVRHERHQGVGSTTVGKLAARYEVSNALALRGTVNNGFSAPSLQQQHLSTSGSSYTINAVTGVLGQGFSRNVAVDDPAALALGAQPLRPERSRNASLGLVFTPSRNTNVTLDLYQIDINDRILQTTLLNSALISPVLAAAGLEPNQSIAFRQNAADTRTRGVDLVIDHTTRLEQWGRIKWVGLANYRKTTLRSIRGTPAELAGTGATLFGRDVQGRLTDGFPKSTISLSGTWYIHDLEATLRATRYGSVTGRNAVSAARDEYVKAATIFDVNLSYWFSDGIKLSIGANNVLNRRPEQISDEALRYYRHPAGRPVYSWWSPYGISGGHYYLRADILW